MTRHAVFAMSGGSRIVTPCSGALRGEVFIARGDLAVARGERAQALEVARRLGNPPQLWRTLIAIGVACQAEQKGAAAQAAYREAVLIMERLASELVDERLRSAFLRSSEARVFVVAPAPRSRDSMEFCKGVSRSASRRAAGELLATPDPSVRFFGHGVGRDNYALANTWAGCSNPLDRLTRAARVPYRSTRRDFGHRCPGPGHAPGQRPGNRPIASLRPHRARPGPSQ